MADVAEQDLVVAYVYWNNWDVERSGQTCQNMGRAFPEEAGVPRFVVGFDDGVLIEVAGQCLNPWYPTE